VLLNVKARLILSLGLNMQESGRVEECATARKVWIAIQSHHEGTLHVT